MSHVGASPGRTRSLTLRSVALLATGVLTLPALSACSSDQGASEGTAAAADIASAPRDTVAQGGTVRWAIDTMPATLNVFQADADAATNRIAGAVLPSLFTFDERGRPQRNPDYLESAKIVDREPKQVVLYRLNQQAVWSDGREIGAPDFVAQWHALRGKDSAFWTARNAGYERIEKIERGADDLEVRVTFSKRYADWKALFSPLYPKDVMASASSFNEGARVTLKTTAGPFVVSKVDRPGKRVTLVRNPRWWGDRAKLDSLVLSAVPRSGRAAALGTGKLDIAEIDRGVAERISLAARDKGNGGAAARPLTHGPGAEITLDAELKSWALTFSEDDDKAEAAREARAKVAAAVRTYTSEQRTLSGYVVRKSLDPSYTQLALNGETGPLADERVRRAVARALDRRELAEAVLGPLGLPAKPLGSHLALAGQQAYADSSDALGDQDTHEAQALLADAGFTLEGARKKQEGTKAGSQGEKTAPKGEKSAASDEKRDTAKGEEAVEGEDAVEDPARDAGDGAGQAGAKAPGEKKAGEKPAAGKSEAPSGDGGGAAGDDKPGRGVPGAGSGRPPAAAFGGAAALLMAEAYDGADARRQPVKAVQDKQPAQEKRPAQEKKPGGMAGAYAPAGTAAPVAKGGPLGKDGKPLTLRFVLPAGQGSESLRSVGERIARMLDRIGIRTAITKVADDSFFKDHIAAGDYDLALYSWPATAYPATDGRPIFAKPQAATDGSLLVEQNYTRVGTDHINQLFDQAVAELDEKAARDLLKQADARIWAAAGSIPLYQRPQLVAGRPTLLNVGAFGFAAPRYQDIGFKQTGSEVPKKK